MTLKDVHGTLLSIAWAFLLDIGVLINRISRRKRSALDYQTLHGIVMSVAWILSTTSIILVTANWGVDIADDAVANIHILNGYLMGTLTTANLVAGLTYLFYLRRRKGAGTDHKLIKMHRINGYIIFFLTKTNLAVGAFYFGGPLWAASIASYFVFLLVVHTMIHLWLHKQDSESRKRLYQTQPNLIHNLLLEALEAGKSRKEILRELPEIRWVILGNKVFDVTNFKHPGGDYILKSVIGREVSRFLYGGYGLESSTVPPHVHSAKAFEILEKRFVGELNNIENVIFRSENVSNPQREYNLMLDDYTRINLENKMPLLKQNKQLNRWILKQKEDFSPSFARFDLYSPNTKVKLFGKTTSWIGRHFLVRSAQNPKLARTYTMAMALTAENKAITNSLVQYFEEIMAHEYSNVTLTQPIWTDHISLFIKKYSFPNGFSKVIHEMSLGSEFIIEGPMGRGLELSPDFQGDLYIICGGTGIFPFLDLLNFFLLKSIYSVLKNKKGNAFLDIFKELGVDFEALSNTKIHLIAAVTKNDAIAYGLDIVKKLAEINNRYHLNAFDAITTCDIGDNVKTQEGHFTMEFFQNNIETNGEAYYVCGNPSFNHDIPPILLSLGIESENIIIN